MTLFAGLMSFWLLTSENHINPGIPITFCAVLTLLALHFKGKGMIIYEVNLSVNKDIYSQFEIWLKKHVKEMLEFPGFTQASILKPEKENNIEQEYITIQYQLKNRSDLQRYFEEFAAGMREEGIKLFNNQFSAERRIF